MKNIGLKIRDAFLDQHDYRGPFFVIDSAAIEKRASEFKKSFTVFPNVQFLYSYKVNSLKDICTQLKEIGYGANVASGFELSAALKDGHAPENVFFSSPVKTDAELELAIKNNIAIQLDNVQDWYAIKRIAGENVKDLRLGLRLAHNYEKGHLSRFGFLANDFIEIYQDIRKTGAKVSGVHIHIGSNIMQVEKYLLEIDRYADLLRMLINDSVDALPWIDLGGGFPALSNRESDAMPDLSQWALRILTHMMGKRLDVSKFKLILEPGRHLVEDAGYLFTRVAVVKNRYSENLLFLDTGLNHVRSFHGWKHNLISLDDDNVEKPIEYRVYGSNYYEGDIFHPGMPISKVEVGDWFMISHAGGYDIPSMNPWMRAFPTIYTYHGDIVKVSRPGSTILESRVGL